MKISNIKILKKFKNLKITGQLIILYSIVLIIALSLFSVLTFNRLQDTSDSITLNTLENYVSLTSQDWEDGDDIEINLPDSIYYVQGTMQFTIIGTNYKWLSATIVDQSERIGDILDLKNDGIQDLLDMANINPNTSVSSISDFDESTLYYSYSATELDATNNVEFIIFLTNEESTSSFRTTMTFQMIAIFIVAIAVTLLILVTWSRNHVRRIKRLKNHILNLPLTNYNEPYLDVGKDELSELSKSIEDMRNQISKNEKTKQEMLQNITHDFKTPITVIKGYAEAMKSGVESKDGSEVIINQSKILLNKTQQLITYNRLEYLTKNREFEDVNMTRVIKSVVNNLKPQRPELKYELDLTEQVYFKGYPDNFVIVIENIIDNSIRYAKENIKVVLKDDYISIFNDGQPIEDKFIKEGFKAYEKGSKGKFGLGMSIVVKTLDFFGYSLTSKNLDNGVEFIIKLKEINKV